jgi:hypothetical protein
LEDLKRGFLDELQRIQKTAHRLIDNLTAISGYTQIVQTRCGPDGRSAGELGKILAAVKKSTAMLRTALENLQDFGRSHL